MFKCIIHVDLSIILRHWGIGSGVMLDTRTNTLNSDSVRGKCGQHDNGFKLNHLPFYWGTCMSLMCFPKKFYLFLFFIFYFWEVYLVNLCWFKMNNLVDFYIVLVRKNSDLKIKIEFFSYIWLFIIYSQKKLQRKWKIDNQTSSKNNHTDYSICSSAINTIFISFIVSIIQIEIPSKYAKAQQICSRCS